MATARFSLTLGCPINSASLCGRSFNSKDVSSSITPSGNGGLPPFFVDGDVGDVGAAGSASYSNGTFTVRGSGADVWGTADAFNYVYESLAGDGAVVARVASLSGEANWVKAGVMMRSTLSPDSMQAFMLVSHAKGVCFQRRVADGAESVSTCGSTSTAPRWVKLVRTGAVISGYESADGTTWTLVGRDTFTYNYNGVYAGLALSSHVRGTLSTATFDNVHLIAGMAPNRAPTASLTSPSDGSTFARTRVDPDRRRRRRQRWRHPQDRHLRQFDADRHRQRIGRGEPLRLHVVESARWELYADGGRHRQRRRQHHVVTRVRQRHRGDAGQSVLVGDIEPNGVLFRRARLVLAGRRDGAKRSLHVDGVDRPGLARSERPRRAGDDHWCGFGTPYVADARQSVRRLPQRDVHDWRHGVSSDPRAVLTVREVRRIPLTSRRLQNEPPAMTHRALVRTVASVFLFFLLAAPRFAAQQAQPNHTLTVAELTYGTGIAAMASDGHGGAWFGADTCNPTLPTTPDAVKPTIPSWDVTHCSAA